MFTALYALLNFISRTCSVGQVKYLIQAVHSVKIVRWLSVRPVTMIQSQCQISSWPNSANLQAYAHPKFKKGLFDYDIGLLQLSSPLRYGRHVRPVCLDSEELNTGNDTIYAFPGYGVEGHS